MVNVRPAVVVGVVIEVITLQDGLYSKAKFLKAKSISKSFFHILLANIIKTSEILSKHFPQQSYVKNDKRSI